MMSEFVCMDWDLQAIVRGCNVGDDSTSMSMDNQPSYFTTPSLQHDVLFKFPDICETTTILNELEELYKPFYPQTILSSPISVPAEVKKPKKQRKQQSLSDSSPSGTDETDLAAKPKRGRKNQQKKLVKQVTADGLSSDMWAWRKYGQKPIKGSPYPRSYYRCSSSKGCLARKQVERSSTDPSIFIIAYSGEHNHNHPTRRSSLAGSTRNKSSMQSASAKNEPADQQSAISPITPSVTSTEDELVHQETMKKEDEHVSEDGEDNEIIMPQLIFNDELFPSLEDLEGLLSDHFPHAFPR